MALHRYTFDARTLEPPEPFEQATATLRTMVPGECLLMRHRRIPFPLLEYSRKRSIQHAVVEVQKDQEYLIVLYYSEDESELQAAGLL